jgi:hypothetical protein
VAVDDEIVSLAGLGLDGVSEGEACCARVTSLRPTPSHVAAVAVVAALGTPISIRLDQMDADDVQ